MAKFTPVLLLCLLTAAAASRVSLRDLGSAGRKLQCARVGRLGGLGLHPPGPSNEPASAPRVRLSHVLADPSPEHPAPSSTLQPILCASCGAWASPTRPSTSSSGTR